MKVPVTSVDGSAEKSPDQESSPRLRSQPWVRIIVVTVVVTVVALLAVWLVTLLLQWRPLDVWSSFGGRFATSPAMAGIAAVVAATIGARALQKQLDHTKSEAKRARDKDAEASWWEKFEWVTDRILPKDPQHAKLAKPLALDLLTSLLKMATADFQREAVRGVVEHYLGPDGGDDAQERDEPARDVDAELRSLRSLVEATKDTSVRSRAAEGALRASMYEQSAIAAISGQPGFQVITQPPLKRIPGAGFGFIPDALVVADGARVILEFKGLFSNVVVQQLAGRVSGMKTAFDADDVIMITPSKVPSAHRLGAGSQHVGRYEGVGLVQWLPEDGPEALEMRIREALTSRA